MIPTLNEAYEARLAALPPETQERVQAHIDAGVVAVSTYGLAQGITRCVLASGGVEKETLWECAFSEAEGAAMGDTLTQLLNSQSLAEKQALDGALKNGARILVALEHTSQGRAGVHLESAGQVVGVLAKLETPPVSLH